MVCTKTYSERYPNTSICYERIVPPTTAAFVLLGTEGTLCSMLRMFQASAGIVKQ